MPAVFDQSAVPGTATPAGRVARIRRFLHCVLRRHPLVRIAAGLALMMLVPVLASALPAAARRLFPCFADFVLASPRFPGMNNRLAAVEVSAAVIMLLAIPAYRRFVRWTEDRAAGETAMRGALPELVFGMLIGAGSFSTAMGLLWLGGYYHAAGFNGPGVLPPVLLLSGSAAVIEELMFRGVLFRIVEEWCGSWIALAVSAAVFGLIHLLNPNATLFAAIAIILEAGILLAAAYMLTRRLWLAMGMHFAWNVTQGGVFGVPVSGIPMPGMLDGKLEGPAWISGGAFGPEASMITVAVCLAVACALLLAAHRRGCFVPGQRARSARVPGAPAQASFAFNDNHARTDDDGRPQQGETVGQRAP